MENRHAPNACNECRFIIHIRVPLLRAQLRCPRLDSGAFRDRRGGGATSGANYTLFGSLGQFTSGTSAGTSYTVEVGFFAFNWDTDGDGMPDWWEELYSGYPCYLDPLVHTDVQQRCSVDDHGNGLTNLEEYLLEVSPQRPGTINARL